MEKVERHPGHWLQQEGLIPLDMLTVLGAPDLQEEARIQVPIFFGVICNKYRYMYIIMNWYCSSQQFSSGLSKP